MWAVCPETLRQMRLEFEAHHAASAQMEHGIKTDLGFWIKAMVHKRRQFLANWRDFPAGRLYCDSYTPLECVFNPAPIVHLLTRSMTTVNHLCQGLAFDHEIDEKVVIFSFCILSSFSSDNFERIMCDESFCNQLRNRVRHVVRPDRCISLCQRNRERVWRSLHIG